MNKGERQVLKTAKLEFTVDVIYDETGRPIRAENTCLYFVGKPYLPMDGFSGMYGYSLPSILSAHYLNLISQEAIRQQR